MNETRTILEQILADPSPRYVPLDNELIWTRAEVKHGRVLLVFDLYGCGICLSDEARELLGNAHREYLASAFKKVGSSKSEFGGTIVRVHVRQQDAQDWFRSIITVLTDCKNLVKFESVV